MTYKSVLFRSLPLVIVCLFFIFFFNQSPTPQQIYRNNLASTYKIMLYVPDDDDSFSCAPKAGIKNIASGTGIAISPHLLLTARHVASPCNQATRLPIDISLITVCIYNKNGVYKKELRAETVKVSEQFDLALVRTEEALPSYIYNISEPKDEMEIGDTMYTIGTCMGMLPSDVRTGTLTSKAFPPIPSLWSSSIPAAGGNSGCGVYSQEDNRFRGIVVLKWGQPSELWITGFVPLKDVLTFLEK